MSSFSYNDLVDTIVTLDAKFYPWRAFVGLVSLRRSAYCARGDSYALDPSKVDQFRDLGQSVVMHPDDVEPARGGLRKKLGGTIGDDELAAFVFYFAMQRRKKA